MTLTLLALFAGLAGLSVGWTAGRLSTHPARRRLRVAAYTDQLTGLLNRAGLQAAHQAVTIRARRLALMAVLMVDLNHFKAVNDACGHAVGDELLVAVAGRLRGVARSRDGVAARLGGDEFVLLVPTTERTAGPHLARQLSRALNGQPYAVAGRRLDVTASVGVAVGSAGASLPGLLHEADRAMYAVKRASSGARGRRVGGSPHRRVRAVARRSHPA